MKAAIVVMEFPHGQDKTEKRRRYKRLLRDADKKATEALGIVGIGKLDQNVWIIENMEEVLGLHFLAWLLASAQHYKIKTRTALLA
jgi:hypothetical protein